MPSHLNRRKFISRSADYGMGFTGLAMGSMLASEGVLKGQQPAQSNGKPQFTPRSKSIIWVFLSGGYSHMETFDPKPALTKYAGKTFAETPFPDPTQSPLHRKRSRSAPAEELNIRDVYKKIFPMQIGYKAHGESKIEITDWWPHLATCVDDISFVRNMWTTDNDHAAENQIHTGRHRLDEVQPSVGAWVHYGLGSINENLPRFVVLGGPTRTDTRESIGAHYLGPQHTGVPLALDPKNPLPFGNRFGDQTSEQQRDEFDLIDGLNRLTARENPKDKQLQARIKSYELAFRMQSAVPEAVDMSDESEECLALYGIDNGSTKVAGERLLAARRMVERGVRFVQVFPSPYGSWDQHNNLKVTHASQCLSVDKPIAGLLKDLKRRGLTDDVTVVFCTEFGRTPGLEARNANPTGRDHHPNGFSVWFAGAGIKQGYVHGATDELGYHALDDGHYVTDLHATVLHLLGVDNRTLEIPGRKRLDIDRGNVIHDILA